MTLNLPSRLVTPVAVSGQVASRILLDLTVYLTGPSEDELEFLLDTYERICPKDRLRQYTIAELGEWWPISRPYLTDSGRSAMAAGVRRPHLQPVRQRIREGRALEVGLWDGRPIQDPDGGWSFSCRRIRLRTRGLHAFVRILMPLSADHGLIREMAVSIADAVEFRSGHGGLAFVYNPWLKETAFEAIYAQARRYWGIDIEDMNGTLPLTTRGIKGVNWVTMVGRGVDSAADVEPGIAGLSAVADVKVERRRHGVVLVAGAQPISGDQNHPDKSQEPYQAIAKALAPLYFTEHPDFPAEQFIRNGNTLGWIRRFLEPSGWR
jgi:hypothetical protein